MQKRNLLPTLLLLPVLLLAACSDDNNDPPAANGATGSANNGVAGSGAALSGGGLSVPDLVEEVQASVVTVVLEQGEGSGVIWDDQGTIVTNNHVVEGATSVTVVLASGERLEAEVIATDPITDLAILRVEREGLSPASFREDLPRVGELSLAVGNPLGFENSVTLGIISGLHRSIPSGGQAPALVDLIQTDAAISPGNSGGALIDANGEVIGVNVAYIPPSASAVALGFAIPSITVVDVVEQLLATGTVEHSFLGIEPRPLTPEIASQLGLDVSEGVVVFGVTPGGAAAEAGIEPGDVITEFDGQTLASIEDLFAALRQTSPGDQVDVTLFRDGQEEAAQATLQDRPAN